MKLELEFTYPVALPNFNRSEPKWEILCAITFVLTNIHLNYRMSFIEWWLCVWRRAETLSVHLGKEQDSPLSLNFKFTLETCNYIIIREGKIPIAKP